MTFQDIFKSSFLDRADSIPLVDMVLALLLAFLVGLWIFWIYKRTFRGVMYSAGFGVSLIALSMITTLVILAVTSNVVLSLGMVGALSLIRFRTAIKEPLDLAFLFWAIAAGIVLAAGLIPLAVFGSLLVGLMLLGFANWKPHDNPYILMVQCADDRAEAAVTEQLQGSLRRMALKSKTVRTDGIELNFEVRLRDADSAFVNRLAALPGVRDVLLVSYNGDYLG